MADDEGKIKVEIISITVGSQVTACRNGEVVPQPNWDNSMEQEDIHDGNGSKRPGIFIIHEDIEGEKKDEEKIEKEKELRARVEKLRDEKYKLRLELEDFKKVTEDLPPPDLDMDKELKDIDKEIEDLNWEIEDFEAKLVKFSEMDSIKIKLKITEFKTEPNQDIYLVGELGQVRFIGNVKGIELDKELDVDVYPNFYPYHFRRVWGDIEWYVWRNGKKTGTVTPEKTCLEIFWIYGYPGSMFRKGVWVEVLRLLDVECTGLTTKESIIRRIVNYCHSGTGLRYDIYSAASHFGLTRTGGTFDLKAYLEKVRPFCNCYDQAGAVQVLLGALGIENVSWAYMIPFGYLKKTNLVGRGSVNNTSYLSTKSPEVIPVNHKDRDGFGNHAFCIWNDGIDDIPLDACTGPYVGMDKKGSNVYCHLQTYLEESIDGLTNLYSLGKYDILCPGNLDSILRDGRGVTDVQGIVYSPFESILDLTVQEKSRVKNFKGKINYNDNDESFSVTKGISYNWKDYEFPEELKDLLTKKRKGLRCNDYIRYGMDACVKLWYFISSDEYTIIELFVANNLQAAKERVIIFALSTPLIEIPFRLKYVTSNNKDEGDSCSGHLEMEESSPYYKIEMWWYYNICVRIFGYNSFIDFSDFSNKFRDEIKKIAKSSCHIDKDNNEFWKSIPIINRIELFQFNGEKLPLSSREIKKKDKIRIEVDTVNNKIKKDSLMLDFYPRGRSLRLLKEDSLALEFEGRDPGLAEVQLVVIDKETLLCSPVQLVTINVVDNESAKDVKQGADI